MATELAPRMGEVPRIQQQPEHRQINAGATSGAPHPGKPASEPPTDLTIIAEGRGIVCAIT